MRWVAATLMILSIPNLCRAACETEKGESVLVLDIPESWGSQTNQSTIPPELPVEGDENQVQLIIQSASEDIFHVSGKRLTLKAPIERDNGKFSTVRLQILCSEKTGSTQRSIAVIVRIVDVNDHAPKFSSSSYSTTISESTPVGTTVFSNITAKDEDAGLNGLVEYQAVPGDGSKTDAYPYLHIPLPHQGLVTLRKQVDYERSHDLYLTVLAVLMSVKAMTEKEFLEELHFVDELCDYEQCELLDQSRNVSLRQTSTTTLSITVLDEDDQSPAFLYQGCVQTEIGICAGLDYQADVTSGVLQGILNVRPDKIRAKDMDSLNAAVQYSFVNGTPDSYNWYFEIDRKYGTIKQRRIVDRNLIKLFTITVKAEEVTEKGHSATAQLRIRVQAVNNNPPVIQASSTIGYVDENSPIGTTVVTNKGGHQPLHLVAVDSDLGSDDASVEYVYELTSTSFKVNKNGYLVVSEGSLDRDPPHPSKYNFQVIAREVNGSGVNSASAPLLISVHINDVNDNNPHLPTYTPVRIEAGNGIRKVTQVQARDNDEGDNAKIIYSVYHVSNNGRDKFRIDPETGTLDVVNKVDAGDQYSVTVQATDSGGRFSQTILDVVVVPGPNTAGPVFTRERYEAQVSEGAALNSTVLSVTALDPERDRIKYSIDSGDDNGTFLIVPNNGNILVVKPLDREEISQYNLVVKAVDPSGFHSTATVAITVTDINDVNPTFTQTDYEFKVKEGVTLALVGTVKAYDEDILLNGELKYSISNNREFSINADSGDIRTRVPLDYETQRVHHLVVTAEDQAPDSRITTASVTVNVIDVEDELPVFDQELYQGMVPENEARHKVIQVKARDPDTVPKVTYVLREGDRRLFDVDPHSGIVRTKAGLDYEERSTYTLVVGTLENNSTWTNATCTVNVDVQDMNDVPPIYTGNPLPIRIQDSVPLGTVVTTVLARDGDGTPPGNQIHYDMSPESTKASSYFLVDGNTGVITVKDDLRKEHDSEYKIKVLARDLGEPVHTATATLTVYVEHLAAPPQESSLGFVDSLYTVEVAENALANTLVKRLTVINKPRAGFPFTCEIISGNGDGLFFVLVNEARDCELRVKSYGLDHEDQMRHMLTIRLSTPSGIVGPSKKTTEVVVNVVDVNDNRPVFMVPDRYSRLTGNRYLAALPADALPGTTFLHVQATDLDSGSNGRLSYQLEDLNEQSHYFKVDPLSGFLSLSRPLTGVLPADLPFKLTLSATDKPDQGPVLSQTVDVFVNLIEEVNRLVLTIREVSTDMALNMKDRIISLIQDKSGLIIDVEKLVPLQVIQNNSLEYDDSGTDVWLIAVDPFTKKILTRDDIRVQKSLLSDAGQAPILRELTQELGVAAERIAEPLLAPSSPTDIAVTLTPLRPVRLAADVTDLGAALIALAAIILVLGIVGVTYHCCMWARYVSYRERLKRFNVMPKYDPIIGESSLKEYETQILQMSVALDEEGGSVRRGSYLSSSSCEGLRDSSSPFQDVGSFRTRSTPSNSEAVFSATTDGSCSAVGTTDDGSNASLDGRIVRNRPDPYRVDDDFFVSPEYLARDNIRSVDPISMTNL